MTTEQVQAAAVAENLKNPDGSDITTEEQLLSARTAAEEVVEEVVEETPEQKQAREAKELEEQALNDPLLRSMLEDHPTSEQIEAKAEEPIVVAAAEPAKTDDAAQMEKDIATLTEWGVKLPDNATAAQLAELVAKGKPAAEAPKPAKKKKFSVVKTPEVIEHIEPVAQHVPPAAARAADADAAYISTLTEEQKDELEEAEVAEMLEPVKFKGQKQKLLEFFRRFDTEVKSIQQSEPGVVLEDNDQFRVLVKAKPSLEAHIIKKVNREIGARKGAATAKAEMAPALQDVQMSQRRMELTPKFQKFVVEEFRPGINLLIESDDKSPVAEAFKVIKEKGIEAARADGFKLEARIYKEETDTAARRVEKFLLLKNNAVPFDPKNPDPDHVWVMDYVDREGKFVQEYERKNGRVADKTRDFLPRREFISMLQSNPAERATLDARTWKTKSFCTFSDIAILDSLARTTKMSIENRILQVQKNAEESGFERRPRGKSPTATNPAAKPTKEINPPRATPAPAAGAARIAPAAKVETPGIDVLGTNYPHLVKR